MNVKKFLIGLLAAMIALSVTVGAQAATRDEIAATKVVRASDFKYWNDDSPTKQKIIQFVEEAIDPNSPNYIPPESRIATFDLDGTLYCETAPYYFQEMMFLHRVLEDESYTPSKYMVAVAQKGKPFIMNKKPLPPKFVDKFVSTMFTAYEGMTPDEYADYVRKFMDTNEIGLTNLKRGEAFYLPMVEIVSYLNNNDFIVYMDSACERSTLRVLIEGLLDIPVERVIGSNIVYVSTAQGKDRADKHFYDRHKEHVVRSGIFGGDNGNNNKIFSIIYEIGRKPVLAFGNSMGDSCMLEYTLQDNPYNSAAFLVLCDDTERELGNLDKAERLKKFAEERGWDTISMRDEFKTIYGDNVKRETN